MVQNSSHYTRGRTVVAIVVVVVIVGASPQPTKCQFKSALGQIVCRISQRTPVRTFFVCKSLILTSTVCFLQVVLIISGNLSFLNWLTIIPSLACFDDKSLAWMFSSQRNSAKWRVWELQQRDLAENKSAPWWRSRESFMTPSGIGCLPVGLVGIGCLSACWVG